MISDVHTFDNENPVFINPFTDYGFKKYSVKRLASLFLLSF